MTPSVPFNVFSVNGTRKNLKNLLNKLGRAGREKPRTHDDLKGKIKRFCECSNNMNQRKTIVNSWVRCLENNQLVITSAFPTGNFRK